MIFDDFDLEVYLNSANAMPQSTLRIVTSSALNDPYQVLQDQYDLSYLSPAYSFDMLNNASFYQSFSPYIRIKHQSRSQDLLTRSRMKTYRSKLSRGRYCDGCMS